MPSFFLLIAFSAWPIMGVVRRVLEGGCEMMKDMAKEMEELL